MKEETQRECPWVKDSTLKDLQKGGGTHLKRNPKREFGRSRFLLGKT